MIELDEEILAAHLVSGVPWVPGAAMIKAAVDAGLKRQAHVRNPKTVIFHRVTFCNSYQPVNGRKARLSVTLADEGSNGTLSFEVKADAYGGKRCLSDGQFRLSSQTYVQPGHPENNCLASSAATLSSPDEIYRALSRIGVDYLDVLRIVEQFSTDGQRAVGHVRIPAPNGPWADHSVIALDAVMQCALLLWASSGGKSTAVPFAFEKAVLPVEYPTTFTVSLQLNGQSSSGLTADIAIHNERGQQIGIIEGLILNCLRELKPESSQEVRSTDITLSSFFTSQPLCKPLREALEANGESVQVREAAYGQVLQALLDETALPDNDEDIRLVMVRAEDFISKKNHAFAENSADSGFNQDLGLPLPTYKQLPNGMRIAQLNEYETDYLYREIFECQAYRDDRVELPDDAVIIDIGANIGMFSLSMGSALERATIFAFEPSPQAYLALKENVKRFGGRVHAFNCGIGREEQTASFTVYPNSSVFSSFEADLDGDEAAVRKLVENSLADKGLGDDKDAWVEHFMKDRMDARTIECQLRSLSAVIDEHDMRFIDLLKIDAEKSEVAVLDGLREEHWSRIRQVIIEVHDLTGKISDDIVIRLRKHGFEVDIRQEVALEESGLFNLYAVNTALAPPAYDERTALHKAKANIELLVAAARQFRDRRSTARVLCAVCPPSPWAQRVLGSAWIQSVEDHLIGCLAAEGPNLAALRASDHLHIAPLVSADALSAEMGDIPYTSEYFDNLAGLLAKRIAAFHRSPYKVLVLDCDNTLWGGVCGEMTPGQLDLGGPFLSLRWQLKGLLQAGYLLCLCSKNDPETVRDVFRARDDLVLEWEDFVAVEIGWGRKSQSLRSLAKRLDLGLTDFVFIDDNPVECAEVHADLPEVLVIKVPGEGDFTEGYFERHWALQTYDATAEDAKRTRFYRENVQRNDLRKGSLSLQSFLEGLNLQVRLESIAAPDLPRAAQLTARTNQFNIHKQVFSAEAIESQIGQPGTFARLVHVFDRFGDYGITGLVLARCEKAVIRISTFLLSCRVLGKGVEELVLSMLANEFAAMGIQEVCFEFVQSKRNTPAQTLLARLDPTAVSHEGVAVEYRCTLGRLAEPLPVDRNHSRPMASEITDQPGEALSVIETRLTRQPEALRSALVELFAQTLGVNQSRIDPTASIDGLGVTSMQLIALTKGLDALLGRVKRTILFEKQTINALVDHFCKPSNSDDSETGHVAPKLAPSPQQRVDAPLRMAADKAPKAGAARHGISRIAIVGMAGRFPMARDTRNFWKNLIAGRDCTGLLADRTILAKGAGSDHLRPPYTDAAGLIEGMAEFDAGFFGIAPDEARLISPQQRLFLQEAWNALEDAGYRWKSGADEVGIFVGAMADDYALAGQEAVLSGARMYADADTHEIANRASYLFNFTGPSMAVDTACSSSLTALHLACSSLRLGECHSALVGGVNLISHRSRFTRYCDKELLSRSGVTASFADDADGFVDGEGVGCILLRPLEDALDDGDHIYGTVLGSAINNRGRSGGFHMPGAQSHRAVIEKAYVVAGISPASISLVEAQGAGSPLGDGIELEALGDIHGSGREVAGSCVIGSLKPNIGHLEAAAGIASVMKVLLQMSHRMIVPMAASGRGVSPAALSSSPFVIQHRPLTWIADTNPSAARRAGIAAFGATGSNAFVIIEEDPRRNGFGPERNEAGHVLDRIIVLSANTEKALHGRVAQLRDMIGDPGTPERFAGDLLARIAHTLQVGRRPLNHRLALVVTGLEDLASQLDGILRDGERRTSGSIPYWGKYRGLDRGITGDQANTEALNPLEARSLERFVQSGDAAAIASLWANGAEIDWSTLGRSHIPEKLPMPAYPFARDVFWISDIRASGERDTKSAVDLSESNVERAIADYLHARLGIAPEALDRDMDLHRYGANSLFALRLVSHLNAEYGSRITIHDVFAHFTARGIASLIDRPTTDSPPRPEADLIEQLEKLALAERSNIQITTTFPGKA